jgi:hypothetical protein
MSNPNVVPSDQYKDIRPVLFNRPIPAQTLKKVEHHFEIAFDPSKPFLERVGNFLSGESKLGRKAGAILDIATIFIPYGGKVNQTRTAIKTITGKAMDKPRTKSKTIWGAAIIVITAVLQAFDVDLNANPELVEAVYQVVYALAGFLGLYGLRDAIGKQIPPPPQNNQ